MKLIGYKEEDLNNIVSLLNTLEFIPGRNIANGQKLAGIFEILNTRGTLIENQEPNIEESQV